MTDADFDTTVRSLAAIQIPPTQASQVGTTESAITINCASGWDEVNADAKVVVTDAVYAIPGIDLYAPLLIAPLIEILWPDCANGDDPWDSIEKNVEAVVNQQIDDAVKSQVDDDLAGLKLVLKDYVDVVDPSNMSPPSYILDKFTAAQSAFELSAPHFQSAGYEVLLLPEFALMADLYLPLLADGVRHGAEWGLSARDVDLLETQLTTLIADYQTYAYTTFQNHRWQQIIIPAIADLKTDSVTKFNHLNEFDSPMTVSVLDHAALWPYFDPIKYPNGFDAKVTREIYSDVEGKLGTDPTVSISFPLDRTKLYPQSDQPIVHLNVWGYDYIYALQVGFPSGAGPITGYIHHDRDDSQRPYGGSFAVGAPGAATTGHGPMMRVYGYAGDVLNAVGFTFADGFDTGTMGHHYQYNFEHDWVGGSAFDFRYDENVISSIKSLGNSSAYQSVSGIVVGFRDPSYYCDATVEPCLVDVYRAYNGAGRHYYPNSLAEAYAPGWTLERQPAYRLKIHPGSQLAAWYNCDLGSGLHLTTTSATCESAGYNFGILGYIGTVQVPGSTPLYRAYNPTSFDHFFTTDQAEFQSALSGAGYRDEGVVGYVWDTCASKPDGATCDAGTDSPRTFTCSRKECQPCKPAGKCSTTTATECAFDSQCPSGEKCTTAAPRFVDSGDGTIADRQTCLVWEKKDNAGGIHDLNNAYQWSLSGTTDPNGDLFTTFLAELNSSHFAGHSDWRLPTTAGPSFQPTGQAAEIESLFDLGATGCQGTPCVDPVFNANCGIQSQGAEGCTIDGAGGTQQCSCTEAGGYTSSSDAGDASVIWYGDFYRGALYGWRKVDPILVRAVRGGS